MNKKNIIMIIAIVIVIGIIGIILFGKNNDNKTNSNNTLSTQKSNTKSTQSTENKTINLEADESGNIVIDTTNIGSKATFCQVCNPSPKAYFVQNGKNFICQNCKNSFVTDNIGKERGGCNPIPITTDERIDGENTITITKQFIESYKENF